MGFQLRITFTDIIQKQSLHNTYENGKINGYAFQIRLGYYRGLYLSCIDELALEVDGEKVAEKDIRFELREKSFSIAQLPYLISEFWNILDEASLFVHHVGGLAKGAHEVKLTLMLRSPYLPLPGSTQPHAYAPINSCDQAILTLQTGGAK